MLAGYRSVAHYLIQKSLEEQAAAAEQGALCAAADSSATEVAVMESEPSDTSAQTEGGVVACEADEHEATAEGGVVVAVTKGERSRVWIVAGAGLWGVYS